MRPGIRVKIYIPGMKQMATQAADLLFGRGSEWNNKTTLETYLNTNLRALGTYDVFDFTNTNNTVYVELKSRRIRHDAYPTAIIGANKVDWCTDPSKTYWFAYAYADGIYIIKYDKELFDTYQRIDEYQRGTRPDCANNPKRVVLIPHQHLTRV